MAKIARVCAIYGIAAFDDVGAMPYPYALAIMAHVKEQDVTGGRENDVAGTRNGASLLGDAYTEETLPLGDCFNTFVAAGLVREGYSPKHTVRLGRKKIVSLSRLLSRGLVCASVDDAEKSGTFTVDRDIVRQRIQQVMNGSSADLWHEPGFDECLRSVHQRIPFPANRPSRHRREIGSLTSDRQTWDREEHFAVQRLFADMIERGLLCALSTSRSAYAKTLLELCEASNGQRTDSSAHLNICARAALSNDKKILRLHSIASSIQRRKEMRKVEQYLDPAATHLNDGHSIVVNLDQILQDMEGIVQLSLQEH